HSSTFLYGFSHKFMTTSASRAPFVWFSVQNGHLCTLRRSVRNRIIRHLSHHPTSHHAASPRITSTPINTHRISPHHAHHITSHHIASYRIPSHQATPHRIPTSHRITSRTLHRVTSHQLLYFCRRQKTLIMFIGLTTYHRFSNLHYKGASQ